MGASNFYNKNASNIFAVLMGYDQPVLDDNGNETDETEYVFPEDWEYEDLKILILDLMEEKFPEKYVRGGQDDYDRNYHGTALGRLMTDKDYMEVTIQFELTAMIRSGYYEGCNLDWELSIYIDGYEHDDIDEALEEWQYQAEKWNNKGLVKANLSKVNDWLIKTYNELVNDMETIFAEVSDHKLGVTARFSNGETIYHKI